MQVNRLLFLCLISVLFSCQKENMTPINYLSHIKSVDSGMLKEKKLGGFVFHLQKEPIPYKFLIHHKQDNFSHMELEEYLKDMGGMQYYTLKIGVENSNENILMYQLQSELDYQNRLGYFSFAFEQDIYLEENGKILPCSLFHFERMYDLTPMRTFVLGFEQNPNNENEDKTIVIDSEFFGVGKVKLNIKGSDIAALPSVKFE